MILMLNSMFLEEMTRVWQHSSMESIRVSCFWMLSLMDSSDMLDEVVVLTVVFVGTEELLDKLMIWW